MVKVFMFVSSEVLQLSGIVVNPFYAFLSNFFQVLLLNWEDCFHSVGNSSVSCKVGLYKALIYSTVNMLLTIDRSRNAPTTTGAPTDTESKAM